MRKRARRIKVNARGWLTARTLPGFVCQIADLSITGCRVTARNMPTLPDRVSLTIIDADLTADCKVVRQDRFEAALQFVTRSTQSERGAGAEAEPG